MKKAFLTHLFFYIIVLSSIAQLPESAEDIAPLLISEKVPSVDVISLNGVSVLLPDIVKEKPAILLFYRGGWCPYCNAHLAAVGEVEEEILNFGYQVIAINPDSQEQLKATADKQNLNYNLYSDARGALIKAMGIAFKAPDRYQDRLSNYSGGQNPGLLPVPSLFIVDSEGTIIFEYISPDYKQRISADLLLVVLEQYVKNNR